MDKLIVTIIGIALMGATMVVGIGYMAPSYSNSMATARAQKWLAEAAQVAIAARQAGSLAAASDDWKQGSSSGLVASALVTKYLTDLPRHNGKYVFYPCYITGGNTSCPRNASDATILQATVESSSVCRAIQKLANRGSATLPTGSKSGTSPFVITTTSSSDTLTVNSSKQFNCVNVSSTYYFFYRVFMDR